MTQAKRKLPLEKLLGRTMLVSWDRNRLDGEIVQLITAYHITGVVINEQAWEQEKKLAQFTRYLQYYAGQNNPLLIATNLPTQAETALTEATKLPPLQQLGEIDNRLYTRQIAQIVAEEQRKLGVNMLIGPTVAANENDGMSFSGDIQKTANHVVAMVQGIAKADVACAVTGITPVKDPLERVDRKNTMHYPLYKAVQENVPIIFLDQLDETFIAETIIGDLQFAGVIAYRLQAPAQDTLTAANEVINALEHGVHLIYVPYAYKEQIALFHQLLDLAKKGVLNGDKLVQAVQKINFVKATYARNHLATYHFASFQTRHALNVVSNIAASLTKE